MPTPGSYAGLKSFWPTPRMLAVIDGPNEAPCGLSVTLGAVSATCARLVWLRASMIAALTAVIAIGTSCSFWSRNCAVTTMSGVVLSAALASSAAAAWGAAPCAKAGVAQANASAGMLLANASCTKPIRVLVKVMVPLLVDRLLPGAS